MALDARDYRTQDQPTPYFGTCAPPKSKDPEELIKQVKDCCTWVEAERKLRPATPYRVYRDDLLHDSQGDRRIWEDEIESCLTRGYAAYGTIVGLGRHVSSTPISQLTRSTSLCQQTWTITE